MLEKLQNFYVAVDNCETRIKTWGGDSKNLEGILLFRILFFKRESSYSIFYLNPAFPPSYLSRWFTIIKKKPVAKMHWAASNGSLKQAPLKNKG